MPFFFFSLLAFDNDVIAQCYNTSISDISFDPNPIPRVESNSSTTMTFNYCNEEEEIPVIDSIDTQLIICSYNLTAENPPTGTYASNFNWIFLLGCWYGTPRGTTIPIGCGTVNVIYKATLNSSICDPKNKVHIVNQYEEIVSESQCNLIDDDNIMLTTYTLPSSQSNQISGQEIRMAFVKLYQVYLKIYQLLLF